MDHILKCNSLSCRRELGDRGVVTTCSHIFCLDCSGQSQLQQRDGERPVCPACKAHLNNPDDVVVANLNPTEDYKTSVLSGLDPNVIMECAGRALNFWAYQTAQEIIYQEYISKNLASKHAALNTQMDKIIHDANAEISNLRNRMSAMQGELDGFRRKNDELLITVRDKSRKLLQTQELYDKLKRRSMLGQVQDAAADAVDQSIQASVTANRMADRAGHQTTRIPQPPLFSTSQSGELRYRDNGAAGAGSAPTLGCSNTNDGTWPSYGNQTNSQSALQTPSTHRQRLSGGPLPQVGLNNTQNRSHGTPSLHQQRSPRLPLGNLSSNNAAHTGLTGYGLSAGLKVSNSAGGNMNAPTRQRISSRVAHRSASGLSGNSNPAFGGTAQQSFFPQGNSYY